MSYPKALAHVRELAFAHNIRSKPELVQKPVRTTPMEVLCRHVPRIRLKLQTNPTDYTLRILEKAGF